MRIYLDVYKELKESLPWMDEMELRKLAYKNWKEANKKQPVIKVDAPKVKKRVLKRRNIPKLYPMSSETCHELAHQTSKRSRFKLCEGRKVRLNFICRSCGRGRSIGYVTPFGLLCPFCAGKKAGGHSEPHIITTAMRN